MTPLPNFNIAQTFYIDPSIAPLNTTVGLTSINVYFKYKPDALNNQSGIQYPGVTLYVTPTIFGVPQITSDALTQFARCEWQNIITTSDASVATNFHLNQPVLVQPGQQYAFILSFDGNERFEPWTAIKGQWLVGTRNTYSGQNNLIGSYYEFVSSQNDPTNNPENAQTQAQYLSFWTPVVDTQMTFDVFAARYAINGVPVLAANLVSTIPIYGGSWGVNWNASNTSLSMLFPSHPVEGIAFDLAHSTVQSFIGAQRVFQNTFSYPGGFANNSTFITVSTTAGNTLIIANTQYPNGTAFNWNTIFPTLAGNRQIVLSDVSGWNVRKVTGIANNTALNVSEPVTFTNAIAQFQITPVATVDSTLTTSPYGKTEHFLWLTGSTANSTVRFVNNCILSITPASGGTGYNNTDVLYVKGFQNIAGKETGGYVAVANIQTNTAGGITTLYQSNLGCGFCNTSQIVYVVANTASIGNTTSNTSTGSGATFNVTVGATLLTEQTNNIFQNCIVTNINVDDVTAFCNVSSPIGITYDITCFAQYYMNVDPSTFSGFAYYVTQPPQQFDVTLSKLSSLVSNTPVTFVSYSNEFVTHYANGSLNDQVAAGSNISNNFLFSFNASVSQNNDFVAMNTLTGPTIEFGHYIINNSYFGEWTTSGNAWARHLTTVQNFNNFAEDLRVYLTAYKPINTDFRVYAKIQNSNDPEGFTLEDWTELQLIAGQGLTSSTSNPTDYVELGYGFYPYEQLNSFDGTNTTFTVAGSISTVNNSNVITGVNTAFQSVANIVANTMVRIYAPLFGNNDYIVATVTNVSSDVSLTIDQAISSNVNIGGNPALVANGLAMDVLPYSHQAFNNFNNDNVARYYSQSTVRYDGFNTIAIKVILLSNAYSYVPHIHDIRFLGVSA